MPKWGIHQILSLSCPLWAASAKKKFPLAFRHAARPRHQTTTACKFSIYLLTHSNCLIDSLESLQRWQIRRSLESSQGGASWPPRDHHRLDISGDCLLAE